MKVIASYLDSHMNENFTIEEVGVKLIPECRLQIQKRLESLQLRAPAISSTCLKFERENGKIYGELLIQGVWKSFKSSKSGEDEWKIYESLEKDIDKQLNRWKRNRFSSIGTLSAFERTTGGYVV